MSLTREQSQKLEQAVKNLQGIDLAQLQTEIESPQVMADALDVQICGRSC